MRLTIKSNSDQTAARIAMRAKQLPFAAAVALNRTAYKAKPAEEREMRDVFDRPTPYTLSSVFVKRATKSNLNAVISLKDVASKGTPAAVFLLPQITGGTRPMKRFEKALQSIGVLPEGYRVMPGSGATLDAYGNLSRGQIVQILSYFKAFPDAGYKPNITVDRKLSLAKGSKRKLGYIYFVGSPGARLPLGIWQRVQLAGGYAIKPVLIFVRSAKYRPTLDFIRVGELTAKSDLGDELRQALEEAMASR